MSERERTLDGRAIGPQARWPCGDDAACLGTASPDSQWRLHDFDRHAAPDPFALSGSLRVQWTSAAHAQRPVTLDM